VALTLDQAIPCGLVITELLTNALKHAFPESGTDIAGVEIRITIQQNADRGLVLEVSDNGTGLPEAIDVRHTDSLGLQLVNTLMSYQLKGALHVKNVNGTHISIAIPGHSVQR
jgi:two-component sensor histidine kinase